MFDDKTQETLRRLLDLAEHPSTPDAERALAFARIRALVAVPADDARRRTPVAGMDAQLLIKLRPLLKHVDEDDLVDDVHGDLHSFAIRYQLLSEVAGQLAHMLDLRSRLAPGKRHRHDDGVRETAARLAFLLQRSDGFRTSRWRSRRD
ncbi:hypothetical protein ACIBP6_19430 [Nonomuraea terrae]|uniref:hypothetical protein n=1 Tax=Nonomuraea terrae TaxID=2530383 RepID=UPI0037B53C1C